MKFMERSSLLFLVGVFSFISLSYSQDSTALELLPVEIRAERSYTPSKIALSRSHFLSSPASFDDPSRLLMKYPGFSVSNDQNNAIIYDGLPSHYSSWSLYGAQIANPNHLSNAGTANDRPSRSAGGVNMFSGQVIGGLDYHTGIDGPAHGIGGVADMTIRTPYQNSITANIGLIGLEAGIDRVFDKGESSLIANYRYSTVGLLGQLGVDFGGDEITYQDLMTEYRTQWKGQDLRWMAAFGVSNNNHEAQQFSEEEEQEFKDIQDIELDAKNLATAVTLSGQNHRLTLAYSIRDEQKSNSFVWNLEPEEFMAGINEKLLSLYSFKIWKNENWNYSASLNANYFSQNISDENSRNNDFSLLISDRKIVFKESILELRPKLAVQRKIKGSHTVTLGSAAFYRSYNNEFSLLPFAKYGGRIRSFNTSISVQSDMQAVAPEILGMRFRLGNELVNNRKLNSINSWSFKLDVNKSNVGMSLFANQIIDAPIDPLGFGLTGFTELGQLPIARFVNGNTVQVIGAKVYASYDCRGYKVHANYSLMDSRMSDLMNDRLPLDYNQMFNVKLDKLYRISDTKSMRIASSFHFRGGYYQMRIDENESKIQLQTIYSGLGNDRLESYQRLDLRISYIKKGKWKNVISLDIQNVMNRQNDAYYYFDPLQDEIVLQKQLGLIPILSWRVVI